MHASNSNDATLAGPLLVVGYGNPLRSDDGVGPKIAEAVGKWNLSYVRSIACHQLTPELIVPIAAAGMVVFVDAGKDCGSVELREVEPAQSAQTMTHTVDPSSLLQLTKALYGHCPKGLSLTIPSENFSFGEKLSEICAEGMQTALARIHSLNRRPLRSRRSGEFLNAPR